MLKCSNETMATFFVLGKTPDLSILELSAWLSGEKRRKEPGFLRPTERVLLADWPAGFSPESMINRLGGTIKLGKIIQKFENQSEITPDVLARAILEGKKKSQKIFFGFSQEGQNRIDFLKLGLEVKKVLSRYGIKSRFVTSKDKSLSSVVVKKNKLVSERGSELVFIFGVNEIYIGRTLAVQDFESYSLRDYSRPARDPKVGMLPPKLALMMINLARIEPKRVLLDPFCGSGTIMQEAARIGYTNIIGGDISQDMIEKTLTNLDWFKIKSGIFKMDSYYKLYRGDVSKLSEMIPPDSVDGIVTEPHLGPVLRGHEDEQTVYKNIQELSNLYLSAFREFGKILRSGGVVVMIWPIFKIKSILAEINILEEVKKAGFESVLARECPKVVKLTKRGSVIYSRPDQMILREIFKFRKMAG